MNGIAERLFNLLMSFPSAIKNIRWIRSMYPPDEMSEMKNQKAAINSSFE